MSKTSVSENQQGQPGVKEYFQMGESRLASVVVFHGRKNVAHDHSNLSASSEYRKISPTGPQCSAFVVNELLSCDRQMEIDR